MDNSTKETNNINKWLIPLNICMGIAIIVLCGYIAHSEGYLNLGESQRTDLGNSYI